jgi:hypothetical protein
MIGVDFVEVLHALDAGGKEARVAHLREHCFARSLHPDITRELHRFDLRILGVERRAGGRRRA